MNNQVDKMQLSGKLRQEALAKFSKQLKIWDMKMPPVEPLVMDFGQGDFYRVGLIEYWIANEVKAGYCGKYLIVFDGQQCPFHSHQQKHETFHIVKGKVQLIVDDKEHLLNEGDVLVMPPGKVHSFTGIGHALILEISTPCLVDDNDFQEPSIAQWLKISTRK
jgi:quercetin dioxygenase-like cupin family protein